MLYRLLYIVEHKNSSSYSWHLETSLHFGTSTEKSDVTTIKLKPLSSDPTVLVAMYALLPSTSRKAGQISLIVTLAKLR